MAVTDGLLPCPTKKDAPTPVLPQTHSPYFDPLAGSGGEEGHHVREGVVSFNIDCSVVGRHSSLRNSQVTYISLRRRAICMIESWIS